MTERCSETVRDRKYWKAMYEDQLRRKRLLHERYDTLHKASQQVLAIRDDWNLFVNGHGSMVDALRAEGEAWDRLRDLLTDGRPNQEESSRS